MLLSAQHYLPSLHAKSTFFTENNNRQPQSNKTRNKFKKKQTGATTAAMYVGLHGTSNIQNDSADKHFK